MKKIITLILALGMVSSLFVGVMNAGAAEISENQMKSLLSALSIMQSAMQNSSSILRRAVTQLLIRCVLMRLKRPLRQRWW